MGGKKGQKHRKKKDEKPKKSTHIPLIPMPSDKETLEDEMRDIFEEDKVEHRHGSSEPERD